MTTLAQLRAPQPRQTQAAQRTEHGRFVMAGEVLATAVNKRMLERQRAHATIDRMDAAVTALNGTPTQELYVVLKGLIAEVRQARTDVGNSHNAVMEAKMTVLNLDPAFATEALRQPELRAADEWIITERGHFSDQLLKAEACLVSHRALMPDTTGDGGNGGNAGAQAAAQAAPAGLGMDAATFERMLTVVMRERDEAADRQMAASLRATTSGLSTALRTPALECDTFKGTDRENYNSWKTAFRAVYPNTMTPSERFMGLLAKTGGAAKQLLAGLDIANSSYTEGIRRLDDAYGRKDVEIARINRLFRAEKPAGAKDAVALRHLLQRIKDMTFTYEQLGETLSGPYIIDTWLEKMPTVVKEKWVEKCLDDSDRRGNVDAFVRVVERQVKKAEELAVHERPAAAASASDPKKKTAPKDGPKINSATGLVANAEAKRGTPDATGGARPKSKGTKAKNGSGKKKKSSKKSKANFTCDDCKSKSPTHDMTKCKEFLKQDVAQRKAWAFESGRCLRCLLPGHFGRDCTSGLTCQKAGCEYRQTHHTLLHVG